MHPLIPLAVIVAGGYFVRQANRLARQQRQVRRQYRLVVGALGIDSPPFLVFVPGLHGAQYVVWRARGVAYHRVEIDLAWLDTRVGHLGIEAQLAVVSYILGHELAHIGHRLGKDRPWWARQRQERHADRVGGDVVERLGLPLDPARDFASRIGSCSTCTHADGPTRYRDVTDGYCRGS